MAGGAQGCLCKSVTGASILGSRPMWFLNHTIYQAVAADVLTTTCPLAGREMVRWPMGQHHKARPEAPPQGSGGDEMSGCRSPPAFQPGWLENQRQRTREVVLLPNVKVHLKDM